MDLTPVSRTAGRAANRHSGAGGDPVNPGAPPARNLPMTRGLLFFGSPVASSCASLVDLRFMRTAGSASGPSIGHPAPLAAVLGDVPDGVDQSWSGPVSF